MDTHTHLYLQEFDADRDEVINRAMEKGVQKFFLPNIDSGSLPQLLEMVRKYPGHCFPMMGLHPCSVNALYEEELKVVEYWLEKCNTQEKNAFRFCAVGEIGIDLYWDKTFFVQQQYAFRTQIELAKKYSLPIVIHTRNSFDEVFSIVQEMNDEKLKGIFHCFSGTVEQANKIIELKNFKLGIGGVLTFKNSGLDNVVKDIDLKHFVLETDSPYLAPVPYRGKRNESSYLPLIAQKLAELKLVSIEEVAQITSKNSIEIFNIEMKK